MTKKIVDPVKNLILNLCQGQEDIWRYHILAVVRYSKLLAKKLKADVEVVEIAAYLHDIKKLRGEKGDHHIHGAEEAGQILGDLDYSSEKIEMVKCCILKHSSDQNYPPQTIEEKIVASADALSIFDSFLSMAYVAYSVRDLSLENGRDWIAKKYETAWSKLIPEAQKMAKNKYKLIQKIIG